MGLRRYWIRHPRTGQCTHADLHADANGVEKWVTPDGTAIDEKDLRNALDGDGCLILAVIAIVAIVAMVIIIKHLL